MLRFAEFGDAASINTLNKINRMKALSRIGVQYFCSDLCEVSRLQVAAMSALILSSCNAISMLNEVLASMTSEEEDEEGSVS